MTISTRLMGSVLVIALILMSLPVSTHPSRGEVDYHVIDQLLYQEISTRQPDDEIEIIVQFRDRLLESDLRELERLEITVLHRFDVIPGVFARGTVRNVLSLSSYHRTFWMEHNNQFELALHETTSVVKATTPWTAEVKDDTYQDFDFNSQSQLAGLDGSGVTVVIVDTGIDGQHPDFDYGEKLIMNKHKNGADDPWIEKRNSDTSYGHGTHCAGIVAGNGDASGGRQRGVAPGATLIGLGGDWVPFPDESPIHWVVLEGLEWVYENSRPGNNPHNIRVVSNSWGGGGNYDPNDAITVISNKLTYENNVLVVFAAMNEGDENHEGESDTTSQQSKVPSVLSVAAATHDGKGMANFSSRGQKGVYLTYPDITAPGVDIWATRPRGTWLGEYQLIDEDMYYMAISGTSMATPHVAGLAAILFQAAPSLRVSEHHDSYNGPDQSWGNRRDTRIHEVEYILSMTADMIEPTGDNGVPQDRDDGYSGRSMDFAQGHGLINAERAVALALTLEKMREDEPDATVDDARKEYKKVLGSARISEDTDTLTTSWRGEWAQLTNGSNPGSSESFATDQYHKVFIPQASTHLTIDLSYSAYDLNLGTGGRIDVTLDWDGDENSDIQPQPLDIDGNKRYEVPLTEGSPGASSKGKFWNFNVQGEGIKIPFPDPEDEFNEALIEYTIGVQLTIEPDAKISLDKREFTSDMSPWRFDEPSDYHTGARVTLERHTYDVSDVEYQEPFFEKHRTTISVSLILLFLGLVLGYGIMKHGLLLKTDDQAADPGEIDERTGEQWGASGDPDEVKWEPGGHDSASDEVFPTGSDALKNRERTDIPDDPDSFDGEVEWEDPDT